MTVITAFILVFIPLLFCILDFHISNQHNKPVIDIGLPKPGGQLFLFVTIMIIPSQPVKIRHFKFVMETHGTVYNIEKDVRILIQKIS